jgi:hypothetical protein
MTHKSTLTVGRRAASLATLLGLLGIAVAGQATAGCSDGAAPGTRNSAVGTPTATDTGHLIRTAYAEGADWFGPPPIIGLWEFEVRLKGAQNGLPNDFLLDWGLATWHADGTEIQFSAGRPPSAGDVCMGVWSREGRNFKLHHVALGLTPADASGTFVGPTIIRADVTVDPSGNSYTGTYTLTVYPGNPDDGTEFNEKGAALVTFNATIVAKRVQPN